MKGVTVAKQGAPFEPADGIERPSPGSKQVLVKSLYTGINPVDTFQQAGGILVSSWPIVLGCDASGEVVEVGEGTNKFKKGDGVLGCTRLGMPGYSTFQEYFLMDEHLAIRKPDNISYEGAATVGVGALTASLGLIAGLGFKFPEKGEHPKHDEWVIVAGGSGGVGQFVVQLAKICGYKVLATCSPANEALVKSFGAEATVDYKSELASQVSQIESITGGNFSSVYDASSTAEALAVEILSKVSTSDNKKFATVNDWSTIELPPSIKKYGIALGMIGREGEAEQIVTNDIASYIPYLERFLEDGSLKPIGVQITGTGFEAVPEAIKICNAGSKGGKKIVVKLQDA